MTTVIFEIRAEIQMQLTFTLLFSCSGHPKEWMSCYQLPCLQSAVYRVSELEANIENEQISTILEIDNYLTGFSLGASVWVWQCVFAVLGKK